MKSRAPKRPQPLDESSLFDYAVKALARRMRTSREIERLLSPRVEPGESGTRKIAAVVARLQDCRYLDDKAFALAYARLRRDNQGFGRGRVEREMVRKGLDRDRAASAAHEVYGNEQEEDLARRFLARKNLSRPENPAQTAKIVRRLIAAGFTYATAAAILRQWNIDADETAFPPPDETI